MFAVLPIISPIFIVIAIGFAAVKTELLPKSAVPGMGRFVLYFCLPALIFSTLAHTPIREVIEPLYLAAYGGGSLLAFALVFGLSRAFGSQTSAATLNALGSAICNSAFIGYPVLLQVFGTLPAAAFTMTLLVENLLIMPLTLMILELNRALAEGGSTRQVLINFVRRLFTQPILLGILAGLAFSLTGLTLPGVIDRSLEFLAEAAAGVALFVIGGSLVGTQIKGDRRAIAIITLAKLVLHPALVALMVWWLPPFDGQLQTIAILAAAMPMLSIYPVLAGHYVAGGRYAATLVVATLSSFLSLTVVLWLLF
ncbi:hypothetical protein BGP77_15235 [Saccharospirillum sp. MSK14-1]|uniref:AEC family transporter n=1 Tax=Saccharospirillum sp. MSK14-1 TaxID=1897632 RepID=UPI000D36B5B8|nr:AEC family transporter [Saccharospirillum sp. MSK14-1]PTY37827.1 hypothetical protein BGP77_15235 [Saccharospirillum sp. MSK14-1]